MKTVRHNDSPRLRKVEGRHNSLVKELRQAFSRGELTGSGECAIEGFRIVEEAVRSGLRFRAVFFSESGEPRAHRLLPQIASQAESLLLPDKLFSSAVPSQSPQGVAALVQVRPFSAEEVIANPSPGPVLVIAGMQDPGNLGTILRSAEAFGAKGILLGEGSVGAYNSKVVRASAGSVFRVPSAKTRLDLAIELLRSKSLRLLATSSHKGVLLPEANLSDAVAVFIGNEGAGVDKKLLTQMDELIRIPHSPKVESLNAGVAGSILLYEAARQRG